MSTAMWPASWNARRRRKTNAKPRWMSGPVGSIPSLARSGRPSASLRCSSPPGRTSTECWRKSACRRTILEVVGRQSLRAQRVPDPEGEAGDAEHGRDPVEPALHTRPPERRAEPRRKERHRIRVEEAEDPERDDRNRMAVDRPQEQDTDACASTDPVE